MEVRLQVRVQVRVNLWRWAAVGPWEAGWEAVALTQTWLSWKSW